MIRRRPGPNAAPAVTPDMESLAEAHLDDVYRYLLYLSGERALAEDLAADTFERALRQAKRFDATRGSARSWLLSIARTVALDHFRSERRRTAREQRYALDGGDPADQAGLSDGFSASLEAALGRLTAGEREVVALRVILELDTNVTARLLGISPTACSTRLSRALRRLEQEIEANACV